jgi:hypothetical protein
MHAGAFANERIRFVEKEDRTTLLRRSKRHDSDSFPSRQYI